MPETDHKETQAQESAPEQVTAPKPGGLGVFLRREREKRGLSHEQIAEMTRLRRHMVVALEDEAWDVLPPPVFVKGFIKSYAKVLGLDQKEVLDLYGEAPPPESETPNLPLEPQRGGKRPFVFFLAFAVVIGAVLFFVWKQYGTQEKTMPVRERGPGALLLQPAAPPTLPEQEGVEEVKPAQDQKKPAPQIPESEQAPRAEHPRVESEEGRENPPAGMWEEQESPSHEEAVTDTVAESEEAAGWYVLKAVVEDRTWIRVTVDDAEPREYIFQPGSRPQWKARNGFDLLIGNAAGIEFEFNGERIGDLGELGQVTRLKLPEGYEGPPREE
jgi:cytoskeleton protein RodZ